MITIYMRIAVDDKLFPSASRRTNNMNVNLQKFYVYRYGCQHFSHVFYNYTMSWALGVHNSGTSRFHFQ